MTAVFGPGVVYDASRKNRQTQFQVLSQGLRVTSLKLYVPKIEKETRQHLKEHFVGDEGEIDLFSALSELTILTASRTLHGDDVREQLFKQVAELFHDLDQGLTPLTVFWPHAPTKEHCRRDKAREEMVQLFGKMIAQREENPGKTDGLDLFQSFMTMKYKDGSHVTTEEITGLLIALLFAGQHTSCITSTWTSLFIAHDPSIMRRIHTEQTKVMSKRDAALTYDDISEMQLLHDSIRESLLLCPPLILLIRLAMVDIPVKTKEGDAFVIPKGDMVAVSPSVGMRLPEVFVDPNKFDPDRFGEG